ncbi:MAG: hypothetical protein KAJ28_03335 [Flavobacteriaceae bacterium]|nr:hypothetical protein [Flavobacteriaceae bacterium]
MKLKQLYYITLFFILLISCNKKTIQLPETENSDITEIKDVSAAYLFYDVTKKDSVELNRKNLISTTHWLVNVDKRLTLKQAIPSIVFLQNKKRNAEMHKNEAAKNYFTCSNPDIQNLAFIEFTNVVYHNDSFQIFFQKINDNAEKENITFFKFNNDKTVNIGNRKINLKEFNNYLKTMHLLKIVPLDIYLAFHEDLTFQDYITIKSSLLKLKLNDVTISNDEFIYN